MKAHIAANKMKEWEQNRNYNSHVERMKIISSPLNRKRSKKQLLKVGSSASDMIYFRNSHKA